MLATNELISYIAEFGLVMALLKGLPTLQAMNMKNWTCVDNVFMPEELTGLLISCDTAPNLRGPGTDHVPILTVVDTGRPRVAPGPYRDYRTADWKAFRQDLAQRLVHMPEPQALWNNMQFQDAVMNLTGAIQDAIATMVPLTKPVPHSR